MKIFQYILGDYREEMYYWEIIKFYCKIFIWTIVIYSSENLEIKLSTLNIILIGYLLLTIHLKPFKDTLLNRIDALIHAVCFVSINMANMAHKDLIVYEQENKLDKNSKISYSWYFFITVIFAINLPIIFWFFKQIYSIYKPFFFVF